MCPSIPVANPAVFSTRKVRVEVAGAGLEERNRFAMLAAGFAHFLREVTAVQTGSRRHDRLVILRAALVQPGSWLDESAEARTGDTEYCRRECIGVTAIDLVDRRNDR